MALRMTKPLQALSADAVDLLPAQLGVYEIADADGHTLFIGYAGGLEPFGLQTALRREIDRPGAARFRLEYTSGYLTRWEELLMVYLADHGSLPPANADQTTKIGRLSPA
jgi:hypothetical protein